MINLNLKDRSHIYQLIAGISAVSLIIIGCLIILAPFFPAILLAVILTLSAWPAFTWLNTKLKHKTAISSGLMTIALAACFIAPLIIIGTSSADNFTKIYDTIQASLVDGNTPAKLGSYIGKTPLIGEDLEEHWNALTSDRTKMTALLKEYGGATSQTLIGFGATVGRGLIDITLGVIIAYFFFRHGTRVSVRVSSLIETFGGERGQMLLDVSKKTLIGVVYGILGTALVQGVLAAIGFWIAQIPGASFLGLLTFFISFVPGGPPIIWVPVAFWLFSEGHTYMAAFIALWGVIVIGMVDNIIRPYFISRGSNLPFIIVLLGIIGGILAFGFIGIFIGPTLLALAYTLILGWSSAQALPLTPAKAVATSKASKEK